MRFPRRHGQQSHDTHTTEIVEKICATRRRIYMCPTFLRVVLSHLVFHQVLGDYAIYKKYKNKVKRALRSETRTLYMYDNKTVRRLVKSALLYVIHCVAPIVDSLCRTDRGFIVSHRSWIHCVAPIVDSLCRTDRGFIVSYRSWVHLAVHNLRRTTGVRSRSL